MSDSYNVGSRAPEPAGVFLVPSAQAAAHHLDRLTASAMTVESVDREARLVSGLVLPYGQVGYTTAGPVIVPGPGRITIPEDVSRVKLVDEHQDPPKSVGWATAIRDTPQGLRASFRVARTPDGDRVLAEMTPDPEDGHRARDGFSVEMVQLTLNDLGGPAPELEAGALTVVSAVVSPAWANAREDGLAASLTTEEGTRMTEEQRARLAELLATTERTEEQETELRDLLVLANGEAGLTCEVAEEEEEEEAPEEGTQAELQASSRRVVIRRGQPVQVGGAGGGTSTRRRRGRHTVADLAAAQARVFRGESRPEMEAALADITSTANIWTARDDYAGELWDGSEYQERYVPLLLGGPLPSYKGTGWRWVVRPEVQDYAGDKAAVPSNVPETEATEWSAARLAGAHDLDRKFFDFGDREFIDSYYRTMTESFRMRRDEKARLFILAMADLAANAASASVGATIYHAAAKAAQEVFDATGGRTPDYIWTNSADTFGLLNTTAADAPDPRILEMFGVTPDKFMQVPGVPAGTVVAGIRAAGRMRAMSNVPIRVEAINLANGGVDSGLFGYYATEESFVGGVQAAKFGA